MIYIDKDTEIIHIDGLGTELRLEHNLTHSKYVMELILAGEGVLYNEYYFNEISLTQGEYCYTLYNGDDLVQKGLLIYDGEKDSVYTYQNENNIITYEQ